MTIEEIENKSISATTLLARWVSEDTRRHAKVYRPYESTRRDKWFCFLDDGEAETAAWAPVSQDDAVDAVIRDALGKWRKFDKAAFQKAIDSNKKLQFVRTP